MRNLNATDRPLETSSHFGATCQIRCYSDAYSVLLEFELQDSNGNLTLLFDFQQIVPTAHES